MPSTTQNPPAKAISEKVTLERDWKHILPGAIALGTTAGYINCIVIGLFDAPVAHMSGAISRVGLNIAQGQAHDSLSTIRIILGFVLGSVIAGVLIGATTQGPSQRYGSVMMVEALLLLVATILLVQDSIVGPMVAAIACGLQNAMSSSYCGLAIRTSHISGVVTDLGVMLGHWFRHGSMAVWKFQFLICLLFSFGFGGLMGAWLNLLFGPICLLLAVVGCFAAGIVFLSVMQRQSDVDEMLRSTPGEAD